jgi:hypothetical protein
MHDTRFVPTLPDLITPDEYDDYPDGRLVRFQIEVNADGVAVLGDAFRPELLERLLHQLDAGAVEQMLCG